jgi:hypothetical protein
MSQRSVEFTKKVKQSSTRAHAQELIPHNCKPTTYARLQRLIDRIFGAR